MATKLSAFYVGNARPPVPSSHKTGDTVTVQFTHTFTEDVATTDILDLFPIPAGMKVVGLTWNTENISTTTLNFGFMSGTPGDAVSVRTCDTQLRATATAGTEAQSTILALQTALPATSDTPRSLGFVATAASIIAAANKKLHVRLQLTSA